MKSHSSIVVMSQEIIGSHKRGPGVGIKYANQG